MFLLDDARDFDYVETVYFVTRSFSNTRNKLLGFYTHRVKWNPNKTLAVRPSVRLPPGTSVSLEP